MGSSDNAPPPPTVIPEPLPSAPVKAAKDPKPPVVPSRVGIPHQYGTRQRVKFDEKNPLHGTEVDHTFRCLVVLNDDDSYMTVSPPIAEISKILRVIEYDTVGCALLPALDPNMQHYSVFKQILSINRLSWRDDPSIPRTFRQAIKVPKWKQSVCKEQTNIEDHFTFWQAKSAHDVDLRGQG